MSHRVVDVGDGAIVGGAEGPTREDVGGGEG
jgi:hypothetical protein